MTLDYIDIGVTNKVDTAKSPSKVFNETRFAFGTYEFRIIWPVPSDCSPVLVYVVS